MALLCLACRARGGETPPYPYPSLNRLIWPIHLDHRDAVLHKKMFLIASIEWGEGIFRALHIFRGPPAGLGHYIFKIWNTGANLYSLNVQAVSHLAPQIAE